MKNVWTILPYFFLHICWGFFYSTGVKIHCGNKMSFHRLERAKKLQEQKEKELFEKQQQQQQEIAAGKTRWLWPILKCNLPIDCCVYSFFSLSALTAAVAAAAVASNPGLNVAALLASGTQVTPQIAVAAQMAALQAKTLAETGIAVPSYYNPSSVNPMKFAEQEKKRKKLWQGKKDGVRIFFYCTYSHKQALNWQNISHVQFQTSFHTLETVLHCWILFFSPRTNLRQQSCGRSLTLETRTKMLNFAN